MRQVFRFTDCPQSTPISQGRVERLDVDIQLTHIAVDDGHIAQIFAPDKMGLKEPLVHCWKGIRTLPPYPFCCRQSQPRIRQPRWPMQNQSGILCFPLQIRVHGAVARSRISATRWYVWMRLEWQFYYYKTPMVENFVSTLGDVAKWTEKVIPVENGSGIVEPVLHCLRWLV